MAKRSASPKGGPTPARLLDRIRQGDLAPLYLLHGADDLGIEEALRLLVDAAVAPAARAFNLDIFRGEDLDVADLLARATTFPMMAARRLVAVKRLERLPDPALRDLLPLVQNPPDTTVLVFTAEKVDARKKPIAELKKAAVAVEFKPPYEDEVPDWIRRRVDTMGRRIEPEAAHLLQISVGARPRDLANELDKLAIYAHGRKTITRDDVEQVVSASRGASIFEFADAVGRRQPGPALAILKRLLEQGDNPVGVVAMLARHIGILRKARWLQAQRLPRPELAGRLKVPPFFLSGYLEQAARFDDRTLWRAYDALLEADNRLKSRSHTPLVTITNLVCSLCQGAPGRYR